LEARSTPGAMSIFELMAHYILHRNWRVRLAMNGAATNIYMCWVLSVACLFTSVVLLIQAVAISIALMLLCAGFALFAVSFLFFQEAKRIHKINWVMKNEAFFGKASNEV
jgi:ABC-type uncharacterized transport system permease subunit